MVQRHRSFLFATAVILVAGDLWGTIPDRERNALIALHNATDGANWKNKEGWNGAAGTECQWSGVSCNAAETLMRIE